MKKELGTQGAIKQANKVSHEEINSQKEHIKGWFCREKSKTVAKKKTRISPEIATVLCHGLKFTVVNALEQWQWQWQQCLKDATHLAKPFWSH